ncbi:YgfZ/GcvT domain-containing protein [Tundrisphaera lichenicola]|uniref:CAF17-like 4Fe-4S cluster assembly/insertion protein YgfZ n=1 Tax=Tundrisphaera lichenicola TaxID=2029860 RepID=UPI003EB6B297
MPLPHADQRLIVDGGWFDRSGRSRLEISGPDRAKFLHNLVTSDVKRLAEGSGSEAFVTSPQGKTMAYITILATDRAILLRTEPESLEGILPHLRKYGVFDDVSIDDISSTTFEFHLIGSKLGQALAGRGFEAIPDRPLAHAGVAIEGAEIRFVRESPTGRPGLTLIGPIEAAGPIRALLEGEGLPELDPSTFEALRIEAGTPVSGRDVTPNHLPQEVGRDAQAINFVKGCYLGQETVARLDALGHVNKILKGFRVEGEIVPPPGSSLMAEGKAVGTVTSSAWSSGWGGPVALGYVRVAQAEPGTRLDLTFEGGEARATVADLPMLPPTG